MVSPKLTLRSRTKLFFLGPHLQTSAALIGFLKLASNLSRTLHQDHPLTLD